jgi:hypothetical protein
MIVVFCAPYFQWHMLGCYVKIWIKILAWDKPLGWWMYVELNSFYNIFDLTFSWIFEKASSHVLYSSLPRQQYLS